MSNSFSQNIAPHVLHEVALAKMAQAAGQWMQAFVHLERAHVLGQASTKWHVYVHGLMLIWSLRRRDWHELAGQLFRTVGAALTTGVGLIPSGNTGGANVSPFQPMPIPTDLAILIEAAAN
jgi:Protein of unknown function (DUF3703)